MSAFIRLKVFNFNTMDSAHCVCIEKNDCEKYPQKIGADSEHEETKKMNCGKYKEYESKIKNMFVRKK